MESDILDSFIGTGNTHPLPENVEHSIHLDKSYVSDQLPVSLEERDLRKNGYDKENNGVLMKSGTKENCCLSPEISKEEIRSAICSETEENKTSEDMNTKSLPDTKEKRVENISLKTICVTKINELLNLKDDTTAHHVFDDDIGRNYDLNEMCADIDEAFANSDLLNEIVDCDATDSKLTQLKEAQINNKVLAPLDDNVATSNSNDNTNSITVLIQLQNNLTRYIDEFSNYSKTLRFSMPTEDIDKDNCSDDFAHGETPKYVADTKGLKHAETMLCPNEKDDLGDITIEMTDYDRECLEADTYNESSCEQNNSAPKKKPENQAYHPKIVKDSMQFPIYIKSEEHDGTIERNDSPMKDLDDITEKLIEKIKNGSVGNITTPSPLAASNSAVTVLKNIKLRNILELLSSPAKDLHLKQDKQVVAGPTSTLNTLPAKDNKTQNIKHNKKNSETPVSMYSKTVVAYIDLTDDTAQCHTTSTIDGTPTNVLQATDSSTDTNSVPFEEITEKIHKENKKSKHNKTVTTEINSNMKNDQSKDKNIFKANQFDVFTSEDIPEFVIEDRFISQQIPPSIGNGRGKGTGHTSTNDFDNINWDLYNNSRNNSESLSCNSNQVTDIDPDSNTSKISSLNLDSNVADDLPNGVINPFASGYNICDNNNVEKQKVTKNKAIAKNNINLLRLFKSAIDKVKQQTKNTKPLQKASDLRGKIVTSNPNVNVVKPSKFTSIASEAQTVQKPTENTRSRLLKELPVNRVPATKRRSTFPDPLVNYPPKKTKSNPTDLDQESRTSSFTDPLVNYPPKTTKSNPTNLDQESRISTFLDPLVNYLPKTTKSNLDQESRISSFTDPLVNYPPKTTKSNPTNLDQESRISTFLDPLVNYLPETTKSFLDQESRISSFTDPLVNYPPKTTKSNPTNLDQGSRISTLIRDPLVNYPPKKTKSNPTDLYEEHRIKVAIIDRHEYVMSPYKAEYVFQQLETLLFLDNAAPKIYFPRHVARGLLFIICADENSVSLLKWAVKVVSNRLPWTFEVVEENELYKYVEGSIYVPDFWEGGLADLQNHLAVNNPDLNIWFWLLQGVRTTYDVGLSMNYAIDLDIPVFELKKLQTQAFKIVYKESVIRVIIPCPENEKVIVM